MAADVSVLRSFTHEEASVSADSGPSPGRRHRRKDSRGTQRLFPIWERTVTGHFPFFRHQTGNFLRKGCCVTFSVMGRHPAFSLSSQGFSHFPQTFPHHYVTLASPKKFLRFPRLMRKRSPGDTTGTQRGRTPRPPTLYSISERSPRRYRVSIKTTPYTADASVPKVMTGPASSPQSPLYSVSTCGENSIRSLAAPLPIGNASLVSGGGPHTVSGQLLPHQH